jgi:hypothetical protein
LTGLALEADLGLDVFFLELSLAEDDDLEPLEADDEESDDDDYSLY